MRLKTCNQCQKPKFFRDFYKDKSKKDGLHTICKKCHSKNNKLRHQKYPWLRIIHLINQRCYNINCPEYRWYGKKGIQNFLTIEDIKFLIKRDSYHQLKKPSINRKNKNKHYKLKNCEFIESFKNSKQRQKDTPLDISIIQFDLKGNFVKEWNSQTKAQTRLRINNISKVLKRKRKTAGGFIWKYK